MRKKITTLITLIIITILGIIIILNKKNKPYEITDSNNGQFAFFYEDDNGEYQRSDESKWSTGEYILNFENSSCDGENDPSFLSWNNDNNSVILMRNKATKCNLYFDRKVSDFSFTGGIQEFVVPISGTYKLEVWGAQGVTSEDYAKEGKGGYSSGEVFLNAGEKLYVVVGGQGSSTEENGIYKGGFNGGGDGNFLNTQYAYGGGGASHIAKSSGVLATLSDKRNDILIVAGGGGGNGSITEKGSGTGGAGGGLEGTNGVDGLDPLHLTYGGNGATQNGVGACANLDSSENCGSFGQGGSSVDQKRYGGSGGGGGFYGGSQSSRGHAGGGGGSGYIGNPLLQNGKTIAGNSEMPSPTGDTETGHSGNGYAKITLVDIPKVYDFSFKEDVQEFIAPINGNYKIELWGASGGDYEGYYGGKGAYTTGIIHLKKNDKLYIYTGQQGFYGNTELVPYNGGGKAYWTGFGATGGGATDVRLAKTDWKDFDSLKSRIMVAAGGGGANNRNKLTVEGQYYGAGNGGAGGALVGINGEIDLIAAENPTSKTIWGYFYGTGGSQTKAGIGVIGPNCVGNINTDFKLYPSEGYFGYANVNQSTGGGGYFGGGGGEHAGGGGGSSFISGYQGCVAIEDTSSEENIISKCTEENALNNIECSYHYSGKIFTNTIMKAGNESMPSPSGGMETGHLGNGYARITLVSSADENITLTKAIDLSGNDYDGEFIGNTIIKKDGNDGYGIYFDGNKSYVDLGTLPSTIDWEKGFTIEFEAKWLEHRNWSRIFDIGNGHHNDDLVFYLSSTVGGYGFDIFKGSTMIEQNVTTGLSLNVKTKIKIIYKSSEKKVELYKDDNLVQTVSVSGTINNIDRKHCYLGKSNVDYDAYFNGYIYSFKLSDSAGKPIIWYNFN